MEFIVEGIVSKQTQEKFFDVRVVDRYLKRGVISEQDIQNHFKHLPNDEDNFELVMIEEDEIGVGELSEEELKSLPAITEENINDFEFLERNQESQKNKSAGEPTGN